MNITVKVEGQSMGKTAVLNFIELFIRDMFDEVSVSERPNDHEVVFITEEKPKSLYFHDDEAEQIYADDQISVEIYKDGGGVSFVPLTEGDSVPYVSISDAKNIAEKILIHTKNKC